jgi:hypothetical protein
MSGWAWTLTVQVGQLVAALYLIMDIFLEHGHLATPFHSRVSPFRLKKFSLISEIKRNWFRIARVSLGHLKNSFRFFSLPIFHFASIKLFSLRSETKGKPFFRFKRKTVLQH